MLGVIMRYESSVPSLALANGSQSRSSGAFRVYTTGDYDYTIRQALTDADIKVDDNHIQNTLFSCMDTGYIGESVFCEKGCHQIGFDTRSNDFCNT